MTKEEAIKQFTQLQSEIQAKIQETKKLADEFGLCFSCDGGRYYGKGHPDIEAIDEYQESREGEGFMWMPSRFCW